LEFSRPVRVKITVSGGISEDAMIDRYIGACTSDDAQACRIPVKIRKLDRRLTGDIAVAKNRTSAIT
jgi:hypothetical protein